MSKHKIVSRENLIPFILVTALFYLWAIPNNLNDILIPQFMKSFELNRFQATKQVLSLDYYFLPPVRLCFILPPPLVNLEFSFSRYI